MNCSIEAKADIYPTEDLDKVIEAISNIFNYDDLIIEDDKLSITGDLSCLFPFKESLEQRQIRDTARRMLEKGLNEHSNCITFKINKQAAYAGVINLVDGELSPLGEIDVTLRTDNPEEIINWLCNH